MSISTQKKHAGRIRRHSRLRKKIRGEATRPRLAVFRSNRGIHAQLIDDDRGHTLAAVSSVEGELRALAPKEQARRAGELLATRASGAGLDACVFDRGGYRYHGRVRELAEGARKGGLRF